MAVDGSTAGSSPAPAGVDSSGRDRELAAAERLFADPCVRLVTFTGPAGVGKTWTARALAARLGRRGTVAVAPGHVRAGHGHVGEGRIGEGRRAALHVVTADVGRTRTFAELLQAVASAVELPASSAVMGERLAASFAVEPCVVVLDGCERLEGEPHPVELLLRLAPSLRVVATSLRPLDLDEEQVLGLDPLLVPPPATQAAQLRDSAPVRLFLRRAAEAHLRFTPTDADVVAIAELCRRVHGLPLGIEILAARVGTDQPTVMLEHLGSGHEIARQHTGGTGEARHLSLRSALSWCYSMLEPRAARLLRRMSVFAGPATVDMLAIVDAALPGKEPAGRRPSYTQVLDMLSMLVDHRLVDPFLGPGEPAFVLVDLLRDFALEQLVSEGEQAWAEEARVRAVLEFALLRADDMDTGHDAAALSELARSEEDLRWALRRLVGRGDVCDGLRLATALAPFVLRRGYDGFVGPALASLLRIGIRDEVEAGLRARASLWKARLAAQYDDPAGADDLEAALQDALALVRQTGDRDLTLLGASFVLETVPVTMDLDGASAAAAEGLHVAESVGDDAWAGRFCAWAGLVARQNRHANEALELARRGVAHAERSMDPRAQMLLAMLLTGLPQERAGPLLERLPPVDELVATARRLEDAQYEPFVLRMAAGLALRAGDLPTAAARCADCLQVAQRQAGWRDLPFALMLLTLVAVERRNYVEAALFHGMARSRLEVLPPAAWSPWFDRYPAAVEAVQKVIGEAALATLAERGRADMHVNALAVPLAYAESVGGLDRRREAPRSERGRGERGGGERGGGETGRGETGRREGGGGRAEGPPRPEQLTPREQEVLVELTTGATNKQISARLGMTPKTVMHHSTAIYRKLGVRGRAEATAWAFRHGLAE